MINLKETFLKLTSRRYPHDTEDLSMDIVKEILPDVEYTKDEFGNYFTIVNKEDGSYSDTMFCSHLDTIDSGPYIASGKRWDSELKKMVDVDNSGINPDDKSINHVFDGDFVKTDGLTNLGADDKAGTTIMLYLISEKVPGLYYFFVGEESGGIGSSSLSRVFQTKDFPKMNRCVAYDRRGYDSIITRQSGGDCCSDTFANELSSRFNEYGLWYKPDSTGVYTDSHEFTDLISECTNISVGYFSEHTKVEKQDLEFLNILAIVSSKIDWDSLPIVRVMGDYTGKKSKKTYGGYGGWDGWEGEDCVGGYGGYYNNNKHNTYTPKQKSKSYTESVDNQDFEAWYDEQRENNFN